jgi:endonuclease/exonuclease/phosphatase family metal-dependent hydrolase
VGTSLASLNLHGGLDHEDNPYSVTAAVAELDTDIVVVQENWRPLGTGAISLAAEAAADCGYDAYAEIDMISGRTLNELGVATGAGANEPGAWGIAIMSRLPWHSLGTIPLGAARGDVIGERRALTAEVRTADGRRLRVAVAHLTHRLVHGPAQLRRLLAGLEGSSVPTVIAGDLNMCRPTVYFAGPYRPALRGRSWPAHRPVAQIDHILAGPGIAVTNAAVVRSLGSDHRPVRAELTVTGGARLLQDAGAVAARR